MKEYKLLDVKLQTLPKHIVRDSLHSFLNSDSQHQVVTVNPEFIVATRKNQEFLNIINEASLATIDGAGIIKALQFLGHPVSLEDRLTGVKLTEIITDIAVNNNHKILFCLYSKGLTKSDKFFMHLKESYPALDFQVADENTALDKARFFSPQIILVGFGAPYQDLWIAENLSKIPSAKVAVGVGGTFDYMSGKIKRAPKIFRSFGFEWLWRLISQPLRIKRINRAIIVFPFLIIKDRYKKYKEYSTR
ncbi:WecB/TagA/CpsF family glycosyltransferase [bacterium]|nr:WecB/TagA/CpsF family glycosyltransferase [bacterium]